LIGRAELTREAERRARERALANPSGIGAAFLWRPAGDPERAGWTGLVMISDGSQVMQAVVTTTTQSRFATPNAEQLALAVEQLVAAHGGPLGYVTGKVSTKPPPPTSSANAMPRTAIRSGRQSSRSEIPAKNSTAAKKTVERM
jgi:hypothetical protein